MKFINYFKNKLLPKKNNEKDDTYFINDDIDRLVDRLIKWNKNPDSQPDIEFWYQNYDRKGIVPPVKKGESQSEFDEYYPIFQMALEYESENKYKEALDLYLTI